jgi:hypothetical protein
MQVLQTRPLSVEHSEPLLEVPQGNGVGNIRNNPELANALTGSPRVSNSPVKT